MQRRGPAIRTIVRTIYRRGLRRGEHAPFWGDGMDEQHPYASPARHPFSTPCPLFVQTGGSEVLCTDNMELGSQMAAISTTTS